MTIQDKADAILARVPFTPGPWWYRDRMVLEETRGEYVCEVSGAASHPQHKADARLIAEAPEMYRLLRAYVVECLAQGIRLGITGDAQALIARIDGDTK